MKSEDPPGKDAERLRQLSEEVSRIAGSLAKLSMGLASPLRQNYPVTNSNGPDELDVSAETVSWLIRARRERARYLSPELLADPAWDMLLDLLHAELANRPVSVSGVSIASGVPQTTALRWLNTLEQQRLVVRRSDAKDGRRTFVELSRDTSDALRRYVREIVEPRRASLR